MEIFTSGCGIGLAMTDLWSNGVLSGNVSNEALGSYQCVECHSEWKFYGKITHFLYSIQSQRAKKLLFWIFHQDFCGKARETISKEQKINSFHWISSLGLQFFLSLLLPRSYDMCCVKLVDKFIDNILVFFLFCICPEKNVIIYWIVDMIALFFFFCYYCATGGGYVKCGHFRVHP